MNYVNLENARALKELGFDVPCVIGYTESGKETIDTAFNKNIYSSEISAPDFLTAADWLKEKHDIYIWFSSVVTIVTKPDERWFSEPDHRNKAITYAIEQIKSREDETTN